MLLPFAAQHTFPSYSRARQTLLYSFIALSLGLFLTSPFGRTLAQTTEPREEDTIRVSTELLLFPLRIRDQKGHAVTGLTENDLRLQDKDKATTGLYFKAGVDRVALIFALDLSGSVREIVSQQRDAALALFARFNERSSVAVMHFAETARLVVPFDQDGAVAKEGFIFSSGHNQSTAIFNAAAEAVKAFQALPRIRSERHIVILISDGLDNASTVNVQRVVDTAIEQRVSFYIVHLPLFAPRDGRLAVRGPSKGFKELAEKTGGKYFLVGDVKSALMTKQSDLSPIFQAIEEDLKSQYLLGFYISESSRDNRKHVFSVTLNPEGVEYSVWGRRYSRTQKFMINLPPGAKKLPD